MTNLLPIDELNAFTDELDGLTEDETVDRVLDLLTLAYARGNEAANDMLNTDVSANIDDIFAVVFMHIADKTWEQRVREHFANGDKAGIKRVAETETHRVYTQAETDTAENSGKSVVKVWRTMLDDKVRDTHDYLEGVQAEIGAEFFTFDGDKAHHPGGFEKAENNCNCRCVLELKEV